VILDLEGATPQRAIASSLGVVLSIASAAVASGPSILEQAFAQQKPPTTLGLTLPSDIAVEVQPLRVDGIYGPARPAPSVRSFRMRGTNAIVVVAMLPSAPAIVPPPDVSPDALSVRGWYAANYSVEATSLSALRWTENGMTYEIASRSLLVRDLVMLAEQVR
jgi:hypothetical protein